jgi:hypothetical protein
VVGDHRAAKVGPSFGVYSAVNLHRFGRPATCGWWRSCKEAVVVLLAVGGGKTAKEEWRCCEWWGYAAANVLCVLLRRSSFAAELRSTIV